MIQAEISITEVKSPTEMMLGLDSVELKRVPLKNPLLYLMIEDD
jgi:hypothetical protein